MRAFLLLLFCGSALQAQDTTRIIHRNYLTVYSKTKHYPVLVEWMVTKHDVTCTKPVKRQDKFIPDPVLFDDSNINGDYVGSGFDRGHIAPAADNSCQGANVMAESFYLTNMAPQYPSLNRGQWKRLEEHTRYLAMMNDTILVKAGCTGVAKRVKRLSIPTHCWKVITIKKTNNTTGYIFPNLPGSGVDFTQYLVPLDSIRKLFPIDENS